MSKSKTYRGYSDLPVLNFYNILEKTDIKWFYRGYYEDKEVEMSDEQEIELLDRFKKVYSDRIDYVNDIKSKEYFRKIVEVSNAETKLYIMQSTFNVLIEIPVDNKYFAELVKCFDKHGHKFKKKVVSDVIKLEYLEWLKIRIKGFKTKVKVLKAEYKDILEPKKVDGKKFDLLKEKIILQEALEMSINERKTPIKEWDAMVIRAEEKAKANKAQVDKIKNRR